MHWKSWARLWLLAGFLALQIWPYPTVTNPPEKGQAPMPPELQVVIQENCFDCHSHQVRLPLYARVAPLSWWIASEVRRGRAGLNFSTWSDYSPRRRALAWRRSLQRMREQTMPPLPYRLMHPGVIGEDQLIRLENYLKAQEYKETAGLSAQELLAWPAQPLVQSSLPLKGVCRFQGALKGPLRMDQALMVRYGCGQFVIWDPEFQTVRLAPNLGVAMQEIEACLGSDPATSIVRWRRHFREAWRSRLEDLTIQGSPASFHFQSTR